MIAVVAVAHIAWETHLGVEAPSDGALLAYNIGTIVAVILILGIILVLATGD